MNENAHDVCLFITHSFPSIGSANSLCDEKLIRYRAETTKVIVLCYRFPGQDKHQIEGNIEIFRVSKDEFWWIERIARSPRGGTISKFFTKLICRIRQVLYLPLFPNYEPIAVLVLSSKAKKIIRKLGVTRLFADFNGADTLLGGRKASKKSKIDFYPIFWDGMSFGQRSRYVPKRMNDKRKKKLESKVILNSKCAIFLDSCKEKIYSDYSNRPEIFDKIRFIGLPLFDTTSVECPVANNKGEKVQITYGGDLNNRDFSVLLNAINNSPESKKITVNFYPTAGTIEEIKKISAFNFVAVRHHLSASEFEKKCLEANALIAAGVKNPYLPSAKVFRIISLGKPLIYLCRNPNDCLLDAVKHYPLSYIVYEDDGGKTAQGVVPFILQNLSSSVPTSTIENIYYKNTPRAFWKTVDDEFDLAREQKKRTISA